MKPSRTWKTCTRYKDTPSVVGNVITSGINQLDEINDEEDNHDQDEQCFNVGRKVDQYSGLNHPSQNEEEDDIFPTENRVEPVSSIGHVLEPQFNTVVRIHREEPRSFVKVLSHTQPFLITDPRKEQHQERILDGELNTKRVPNHTLADILMSSHRFAVIKSNLYYWNQSLGYFIGLVGDKADIFIRQNIPDHLKGLITFKSSVEIIQWLKTKEQLQVSDETLAMRKGYVAFSNCIVKISDFSIHHHNPDFYFTSAINAEYPIENQVSSKYFERFIQQVTGGDRLKYLRLQELFGYVLSEIREVKYIPFLLGPKDSGKSIVLKLLEHLIGQEFFTNLSFDELNQPTFLCQLFGKKLNACGETSEVALNRLDVFKKLSGGDYVMARFLYGQAFKFINTAALLFSGNHLPILKGIDRSNAFSQRLVIFPFSFQVPKEKQDIHLFDKLLKETPYIVKWSLVGLKRWCQNNFIFTTCEEIEEIAHDYSNQNNSIRSFVSSCCFFDPNLRTHNDVLESAYRTYCRKNGIIEESNKAFHKCMQGIDGLRYSRFRLNNDNKFGYIGIALRSNQGEGDEPIATER